LHLAAPCCAQTAAAGAKALITTHQSRQPSLFIDNRADQSPKSLAASMRPDIEAF
jgi:hypothetical protein